MELVIVGLQLAKCEATVIFLSAKRVCCSSSFLIDDRCFTAQHLN